MARAVVLTGGSNGIGRGILDRLVAGGYLPFNLDRVPPSGAAVGRHIPVDLSDPRATDAALDRVLEEVSPFALINNVGMVAPATLEATRLEDLDRVWGLNLSVAVRCAERLLPSLRETRGRIVNIASRAALGKEQRTAYAASKGGLLGLTRTWALELADAGITVNAVGPGPIATALFQAANPPDSPRTRAIVEAIPVGRLGTARDVAHAVSFFLDENASFITGQVIYVCGGMTVGRAA